MIKKLTTSRWLLSLVLVAFWSYGFAQGTTTPINEDFEGEWPVGGAVAGWLNQNLNLDDASEWKQSQFDGDHTSGAGSYATYTSHNYTNGRTAALVTPALNVTASDYLFSFWAKYILIEGDFGSDDELYVDVEYPTNTWTTLTANLVSGQTNAGWFEETIDLSSYVGNDVKIRFRVISHYGSYNIGIDDVVFPDNAVTPPVFFPYIETFNETWSGTPSAPENWSQIIVSGAAGYGPWQQNSDWPAPDGHDSPYAMAPGTGEPGEYVLISPALDLGTTTDYQLKFKLIGAYPYGGTMTLKVQIASDNSSADNFTTELVSYISDDNPANNTMPLENWGESIVDLSAFSGVQYIAFRMINNNGSAVAIEDVKIEEIQDIPAPGIVTYVAPLNGAINIENGSLLSWTFGDNTDEYQVMLGTSNPPTIEVVAFTSSLKNSYTISGLDAETEYFWQVNAKNSTGTTSGEVWSFTTAEPIPAPVAVTNIAPVNGAIDIKNGSLLSWSFGDNTESYQVMLGTTNPPTDTVVSFTTPLATSYMLAGLRHNTTYYWQVNVANATDTIAGAVWSFTTNTPSFYESFEGETFPPAGWAMINGNDQDSFWARGIYTDYALTDSCFARIDYSETELDDWLITPAFAPESGNSILSFWARSLNSDLERFNVMLSTTGQSREDFTVTLASAIQPPTTWEQYSYDLSTYNGQAVYIAVQATSDPWKYSLFLEDFEGPNLYSGTSTPVTDLHVSTEGFATWVHNTKGFEHYEVWLDGASVAETTTPFYQYDRTTLIMGQEYLSEVAAVYSDGASEKTGYTWTYSPCDSFPSPANLTYEVVDVNNVVLSWSGSTSVAKASTLNEGIEGTLPEGWIANTDDAKLTALFARPATGVEIGFQNTQTREAVEIHYDNGYNNNAVGTGGAVSFMSAARFTATELADYYGEYEFTDVKFVIGDDLFTNVTVKIWEGGSFGNPGTEVYSQDVTSQVEVGSMTTVTLTNAVALTAGNEYWIGYSVTTTGGHPAGVDDGPMVSGKGAWMYLNNEWDELTGIAPSLNYNWVIRGVVNIAEAPTYHIGANVYRDGELIAEMVQGKTYTDEDVAMGTYDYCVTYVYENGGESCPGVKCVEVELTGDCPAPFNLTASVGDANEVSLEWNEELPMEFRYDDGISTGQLGFDGGTINSILGAKHNTSAQISEMSWFTTAEGGPHTTVQIYVMGLTAAGMPDGNNVLYTAAVSNADDTWNTHTLSTPVNTDGGFYIALGFDGFAGLATDDGVGEPYVYQNGTHYFTGDYTSNQWVSFESQGFSVNAMIRAIGVAGAKASYTIAPEMQTVSNMSVIYTTNNPVATGTPKWSTPANNINRSIMGYNIYKDGTLLEALWPETNYTYQEAQGGQICYTVTAEYESCGESDPSNEACVTLVDVKTNELSNVKVYPNPSNSTVNIELTSNVSRVVIYNYVGQVVLDNNVTNETTLRIDVRNYEAGAYLVRFVTSEGQSLTKKVIVSK